MGERLQPLRGSGGAERPPATTAASPQERYVVREASAPEWPGSRPEPFWKGRKRRLVPLPEQTYKPCSIKIRERKELYLAPRPTTSLNLSVVPCHGRKGITQQTGWEYTHCPTFKDVYNKRNFAKPVPREASPVRPSCKRLYEPAHNEDLWTHWARDESTRTVPYCWPQKQAYQKGQSPPPVA